MRRRFLLKGISPTSEEGKECLERYRELLDDAEWQKRAAKALETNHEKQLQKCRILQAVVEVWASDSKDARARESHRLGGVGYKGGTQLRRRRWQSDM